MVLVETWAWVLPLQMGEWGGILVLASQLPDNPRTQLQSHSF